MKHIKKFIATILTVAAVFSTCTGTICAESDGRPEGTEMVDEWIDYVDLYYNLTYYVIVGDANEDYVVDQTDATLIMRYVLADSVTPDWLPIIIWGKNLKVQAGDPQKIDYLGREIYYISYVYASKEAGGNVRTAYYAENLPSGEVAVYDANALEGQTADVDAILKLALEPFSIDK